MTRQELVLEVAGVLRNKRSEINEKLAQMERIERRLSKRTYVVEYKHPEYMLDIDLVKAVQKELQFKWKPNEVSHIKAMKFSLKQGIVTMYLDVDMDVEKRA